MLRGRGSPGRGRTEAELRRVISTACHAAFHALATSCADLLIGAGATARPNWARVEVHRGPDHGAVESACEHARRAGIPRGIRDLASAVPSLREARRLRDYDPVVRPTGLDARFHLGPARRSVATPREAGARDRLTFAAWTLITTRGAKQARVRARLSDLSRIDPA